MHLKQYLNNLPIKSKLRLATVATCGVALALAFTALFWFQSVNFRRDFVAELESLGAVVAQNSAAPLAFGDKKSAVEVLSAFKVKPHISAAWVLDADGKLFASFGTNGAPIGALTAEPVGRVNFVGGDAHLGLPITVQDSPPGRLEVRARFRDKYRELLSLYASVLVAVMAGSLVVILVVSAFMQHIITGPIAVLAEVARNVSEKDDYLGRAPEAGRDEVGLLTRTFNQMLDQIQLRDHRLRESQQRFEVAVQGSSDGIWDWDLATNNVYFSPRWKGMLGYADSEVSNHFNSFRDLLHPEDVGRVQYWIESYLDGRDPVFEIEFRMRHKDGSHRWILSRGAALRNAAGSPFRFAGSHTDVTDHKRAAEKIAKMQRELVDTSRLAGMAEVATGVLHNVGNVLNSVNISAALVVDQVRNSKTATLVRTVALLREHEGREGEFLANNPQGRQFPAFLEALAGHLQGEQVALVGEMQGLQQNIEHIKEVVTMQQSFARASGALEHLALSELLEDALRMVSDGIARHGIEIVRQFDAVPLVLADRHKLVQILVNLISNAKDAVQHRAEGRRIEFRILRGGPDRVRVEVTDNGDGIAQENQTRIFRHGFTTKKSGHGFGLHSGANAAREMGGSLTAQSNGPGTGATFVVEVPVGKDSAQPPAPSADKLKRCLTPMSDLGNLPANQTDTSTLTRNQRGHR